MTVLGVRLSRHDITNAALAAPLLLAWIVVMFAACGGTDVRS